MEDHLRAVADSSGDSSTSYRVEGGKYRVSDPGTMTKPNVGTADPDCVMGWVRGPIWDYSRLSVS